MLSRVAENLYWFGRYLERADSVARTADVDHQTSLETEPQSGQSIWAGLIAATASRDAFAQALAKNPRLSQPEFLLLAETHPGSLRSTLTSARTLARGLREHISREIWEEVNVLHLDLARRRHLSGTDIYDLCLRVKRGTQTILGLYDNAALRDEAREWFRCGLYIERADMTSRIIDTKYHVLLPTPADVGGPFDRFQWMAILRSASAWEAYRKTGHHEVTGPEVADFLMFNRDFPRSLAFSVMALLRHYRQAAAMTPRATAIQAERLLTILDLDLAGLNADAVIEDGLHEFLDSFQLRLTEIDRTVTESIFRPTPQTGGAKRGDQ